MKQMKYSIQKLLFDLGLKKTLNKPTLNTAIGKYAYLMFENISNPKISVYDAQMWVAKHKKEIAEFQKNGSYNL